MVTCLGQHRAKRSKDSPFILERLFDHDGSHTWKRVSVLLFDKMQ